MQSFSLFLDPKHWLNNLNFSVPPLIFNEIQITV